MGIRWLTIAVVAVLALPGTALAHDRHDDGKNASKLCKELRAEMGVQKFRADYGTNHNGRNAHGKCVSKHRHLFNRLVAQAVEQCKTERQASMLLRHSGPGKNDADRAAFRECVKQKLRTLIAEFQAKVDAAVAQCKTERDADQAAFDEKYGKGEHKRHAFRRCVFQHVRESTQAA